jgi:DNA primase catalytic subunit
LKEIDQVGQTEYQSRSLEIYKQEDVFKKEIEESLSGIQQENSVIRGVKLERLKINPIRESTQEADIIKDAASEEIKGMLIDEAKNHIDEEKQKQQENVEKNKKAAEEDAKKTEKNQEKWEDNVELENIIELSSIKKDIQTEIEDMIDKMNLLKEDILGVVVDTNI